MKKLSIVFWVLAVLLSDIMCAVVAYNYCDLLLGGKYAGYSAPASTALYIRDSLRSQHYRQHSIGDRLREKGYQSR